MSRKKNNSKRECGWLSDRGHRKLDRVLDVYLQVKKEENDAKLANGFIKCRRIRRDELASPLARDTGLHRTTIGNIVYKNKERVSIKSIDFFFEHLYRFFWNSPVRKTRVNPEDLILNYSTDIEWDKFIEETVDYAPEICDRDWQVLFALLQNIELQDAIAACRQAFISHGFQLNELRTLDDVNDLVSKQDDPEIAIEFANYLIERCQIVSVKEALIEWRDRMAQQYNITVTAKTIADSEPFISSYLLITLKPSGSGNMLLGASLHIEDTEEVEREIIPIDLNGDSGKATWIRCSLDTVPEYLPDAIQSAQLQLCGIQRKKGYNRPIVLALEIFLPYNYLDYRVDEWEIKGVFDGDTTILGQQYPVAVRSLDRSQNRELLFELGNRWSSLKEAICNSTISSTFYLLNNRERDRNYKKFSNELKKYIGLKSPHPLPEDEDDRHQLLKSILMSGIPVAMWVYLPQTTPEETVLAFHRLLTAENLSNFCCFGENIRSIRDRDRHPLRHLGIFWDNPHRQPPLPPPMTIPK